MLVHKDQLACKRYYVGSIIGILAFLAVIYLSEMTMTLECMVQSGSWLF